MDFSCLCGGEGREHLLEAEKGRVAAQPWRIRPSIRFSFSFHENSPLYNDHRRAVKFAPFLISSFFYVTASNFALQAKVLQLCTAKQGRGVGNNPHGWWLIQCRKVNQKN